MDRRLLLRAGAALGALAAGSARAAEAAPRHRIVLQVSANDPAQMNLALTNIVNIAEHYAQAGESLAIDLTAFGPGYAMMRADVSPVKARIAEIRARYPFVRLTACQNARAAMARAEGRRPEEIPQIPEAVGVPAGVVHISELQEQGWTYLRP